MYHVNKSQLLKIFDPTPYLTSTLKKDALILDDTSEIANSQAVVTTAKTFNKFVDGIVKFAHNLFSGLFTFNSYFDSSLKPPTLEASHCGQFFPFIEATNGLARQFFKAQIK